MRRHAFSVTLLAVAGVLLVASGEPSQRIEAHSAAVRVASLNAWLLPFGSDDPTERRDRMGPAIDALEPDVLCLQEVWTEAAFEPLAEALARRLPNVATGGGGLAILSRWPIRDADFQAFPARTATSLSERLARKGWLSVVVETPAGPLRVVDSHLTFDRSDARRNHAEQLALLVEALGSETEVPMILCADLNLRAFQAGTPTEGFALLRGAGFEDAASTGGSGGGAATRAGTRVGWPRVGRTAGWDPDYVLFRQGASGTLSVEAFRQALDTEATALSDHNLQLADFVLESR